MVMSIAIWADGSPHVGAGHLVRTGALAEAAQQRGYAVSASCPPQANELRKWTWAGLKRVSCFADFATFVQQVEREDYDWLIIDDYAITGAALVEASLPRVLMIDDVPGRDLQGVHRVLNQNLSVTADEYSQPTLIGPEYALIRSAFSGQRHNGSEDDILFIPGGSDAATLTPSCVKLLAHGDHRVSVAGSLVPSDNRVHYLGTLNAEQIAARMAAARAVVAACGSVVWEALTVGVPLIGIEIADNQQRISKGLRERGWAPVIRVDELDQLPQLLDQLPLHTPPRLDGRGAGRVLDYLECP